MIGFAVSGGLAAGAVALNKDKIFSGITAIIRSKYFPALLLKKRPSILLVTADTTRYDRCGFNGYRKTTSFNDTRSTTPFLDTLAEKGLVFDSCYSQSNYTMHSIGSMFTSRYVKDIQFNLFRGTNPCLGLGVNTTIAELLQRNGYRTCGAVSMPLLADFDGFSRGFEKYSAPDVEKRRGDETVEILKELIRRQNPARQPAFYYLHIYQPHSPYLAPPEYQIFHTEGEFDDDTRRFIWVPDYNDCALSEKQGRHISDLYDSELHWADANIRDFLDFLMREKYFKFQRDLFIFGSDHGENLMDHGMCGIHDGVFEVTTRVPLFICGGPASVAKRQSSLTMNIDVAPTIAEVAGLKPPDNWEGKSLLCLLNGANEIHNQALTQDVGGNAIISILAGGMRYTHRNPPVLDEEKIQSVKGFQPTGKVQFYGGPPEVFLLSWPNVAAGKKNVYTELKIEDETRLYKDGFLQDGKGKLDTLVSNGETCGKNITCYSESHWNSARAANKLLRWSVEVYQEENDKRIPLLKSAPLSAVFQATPNYLELYDLRRDPGETRNLINEPQYQEKRKALELLVKNHSSGLAPSSDDDKISEKDRQTLKTLGYLR